MTTVSRSNLAGHILELADNRFVPIGIRSRIAAAAGLDSAALEPFVKGPEVAARKAASFELARTAGVFGLPSYLVDGELFWGQDSLPFLVSHLKGETQVA